MTSKTTLSSSLLCLILTTCSAATTEDTLRLAYLNDKKFIHFGLNFLTTETISDKIFGFLPRQIARIITTDDIEFFELSLSRSDWRYDYKLDDANGAKYLYPSGAFLKAKKFGDEGFSKPSWSRFTNSLAGFTCSSLNQIDEKSTGSYLGDQKINYGQLPAEAVCTENLTPWAKLLKTSRDTEKSLLALIQPYRLAEAHYFGLGLKVNVEKLSGGKKQVTMAASLSAVYKNEESINKYMTEPIKSLGQLLRIETSKIIDFEVPVKFDGLQEVDANRLDLGSKLDDLISEAQNHRKDLAVKRYLSSNGRGQLGATVNFKIERTCDTEGEISVDPVTVKITELLPWCTAAFLSSFKESKRSNNLLWQTGKINQRPFMINYEVSLKCQETYTSSYEIENKLLGWTEYPADAERGIFINPGVIEVTGQGFENNRIFSPGLIVDVPKPDFSMPFNALCLACTAVAILFGHVHNCTTSPLEIASEKNEKFAIRKFKQAKAWVMEKLGKKSTEQAEVTTENETKEAEEEEKTDAKPDAEEQE